MRTKESIKNMIIAAISNVLSMLVGFITQAVFLKSLGTEYLGINGLFNNIISMLSMIELGIGIAIMSNLYKPIANNDENEILGLMNFYRKSYIKIGSAILLLGILIIPFLKLIIGTTSIKINIYIVYLLFLLDTVLFYFLSYKRTLLIAKGKNYFINIIHIFYLIILNASQICILIFTKNYYLYIIIKVAMRIFENVVINILVNKKNSFIKNVKNGTVNRQVEKSIYKKVKALIFHKFGTFIVTGTDNILISIFFGISSVGLYSNYYLIINSICGILTQVFSSITANVGNLMTEDNKDKQYRIFKIIYFFNFLISSISGIILFMLIEPFISIWIGSNYLMSKYILIVLMINFYFTVMRSTFNIFKDAVGIYYEDRFVPIIESICNIVLSILFAKIFGLIGIFMGTISSQLILHLYSYPKYVCKKLFQTNYKQYYIDFIVKFGIFIILLGITSSSSTIILSLLKISNNMIVLLINLLISIIIPGIILILIFRKTEEFAFCTYRIKILLLKIKHTNNKALNNQKNMKKS